MVGREWWREERVAEGRWNNGEEGSCGEEVVVLVLCYHSHVLGPCRCSCMLGPCHYSGMLGPHHHSHVLVLRLFGSWWLWLPSHCHCPFSLLLVFAGPVRWTGKKTEIGLNPTAKDGTTGCGCTNSEFFRLPVAMFVEKSKNRKKPV